jgi:hypothetical protein
MRQLDQNENNGSDITKVPPSPPAPHVEYRQSNGDTSVRIGGLAQTPAPGGLRSRGADPWNSARIGCSTSSVGASRKW